MDPIEDTEDNLDRPEVLKMGTYIVDRFVKKYTTGTIGCFRVKAITSLGSKVDHHSKDGIAF